jgi:hypothetical protein
MNALQIIAAIPTIIGVIKSIEDAIPLPSQGAAKLDAVRQILVAVDGAYADVWPRIQAVINVLISLFNATIWKK